MFEFTQKSEFELLLQFITTNFQVAEVNFLFVKIQVGPQKKKKNTSANTIERANQIISVCLSA